MTDTERPTRVTPPADEPTPQEGRANLLRLGLLVGGIVLLAVLTGSWPVVVVIAAIIIMVFFHELGHYLTAKWAGMKVSEFFIGFGPKLWSFRRGETEYGFKPVLVGAYVKIAGMHNLDEVDPADERRTYRQAPYWRRMSVALAGSTMHFLMALILLFAIFAVLGTPNGDSSNWTIGAVSADSPAKKAGLQEGDRLLAIDGHPLHEFTDVRGLVKDKGGQQVTLEFERDGKVLTAATTLDKENPGGEHVGFLGVGGHFPTERVNPVTAVGRSGRYFGTITWESAKALGSFFTPSHLHEYATKVTNPAADKSKASNGDQPSSSDNNRFLSPIGAVRLGAHETESGIASLLWFLVLINIFVGMFNLVPLLPLDGGHVAIATYEKVRSMLSGRRYHVDVAKLMPITYAVVLVLVTIGITALYLDVVDPIKLP